MPPRSCRPFRMAGAVWNPRKAHLKHAVRPIIEHTEQGTSVDIARKPQNACVQSTGEEKKDMSGKALEKKAPEVAFMACLCHDKIREDLIANSHIALSHSLCSQMLANMFW